MHFLARPLAENEVLLHSDSESPSQLNSLQVVAQTLIDCGFNTIDHLPPSPRILPRDELALKKEQKAAEAFSLDINTETQGKGRWREGGVAEESWIILAEMKLLEIKSSERERETHRVQM